MKKLAALLLIMPLLGGCPAVTGIFQPLHTNVVVENEDAAVKAYRLAHEAIDEANSILFAVDKTIGNNAEAGVWTKAQAQAYLDQSKDYGKKLDKAREMMRVGNLADAKSQADAIKSFVLILQKEVAKAARK